jgi:hypothetical protein
MEYNSLVSRRSLLFQKHFQQALPDGTRGCLDAIRTAIMGLLRRGDGKSGGLLRLDVIKYPHEDDKSSV